MSVVPGFKHDLFVSYAHQNDRPWGWVSNFIETLKEELAGKSRDFSMWWDPGLRSGENFDVAIADAISESAVFLSILSPAYGDSTYCRREVEEFRQQRHPAFGLLVGSMSRMQAIVIDREFTRDRWAPELRSTSPQPFFDDRTSLFSRPSALSAADPWINALWKVRDSIWAVLNDMRAQKERGAANARSYDARPFDAPLSAHSSAHSSAAPGATIYLAEVTDDLYRRRQNLRSATAEVGSFTVQSWSNPASPPDSGLNALSVHLFGRYPGRAFGDGEVPLPQLQLEAAVAAKPARRPLVWLARELDLNEAETPEHRQFLQSLLSSNEIELLRIDFEDLKDELPKRLRPPTAASLKIRSTRGDSPIIHIWHSVGNPVALQPLKQFLNEHDCGISVFHYGTEPTEKMHSRLAVCDGLIVPYGPESRTWAEDVMTEAFRLRRREQRPTAFAAVELPPATDGAFNFEHPRVVPIHVQRPSDFTGMAQFLARLEEAGA